MKCDYLPKIGYKRVIVICLYLLFGGIILYFFGKYILEPIAPFLFAYTFAAATHSLIVKISRKFKINEKIICIAVITVLLLIICCFLFGLIKKLIYEGNRFLEQGVEAYNTFRNGTNGIIEKICSLIPFSDKKTGIETVSSYVWSFFDNLVEKVAEKLPVIIGYFISTLPQILFTFVIFVISSYYFSVSYENVNDFISKMLPENINHRIAKLKSYIKISVVRYLKAYMILMLITFAELSVGFLILKVKNTFLTAFIIAFADMLPIIGLCMILVPWALICFAGGKIKFGIGLLVLYAVAEAVRQIIEPKIVGKSIGLHPLATLIGIYVGFRLFGIIGLLTLPLLIITVKNANIIKQNKYNT